MKKHRILYRKKNPTEYERTVELDEHQNYGITFLPFEKGQSVIIILLYAQSDFILTIRGSSDNILEMLKT